MVEVLWTVEMLLLVPAILLAREVNIRTGVKEKPLIQLLSDNKTTP